MKKHIVTLLLFTAVLFCFGTVNAQNSKKDKKAAKVLALKKIIDTANFVFSAKIAYPAHGTASTLSYGYTFKVANGKVECDLPYIGQVAIISMDNRDQGIKFTSDKYEYFVQDKSFGWNVMVRLNDKTVAPATDIKEITMSITPDGNANLQLSFANRESIVYEGEIGEYKKK